MSKRGLAVVYDPHNLYQFVWYFCNKGKEKEWDALCLPNGYKGEYMHPYCEAAGIFSRIFRDDTDFSILPAGKKLKEFSKMFAWFLAGKRKDYCERLLGQYVNVDDYDEFAVIADVGIVSGACVALGGQKEVVILEDGLSDYSRRTPFIPQKKLLSSYAWQGFVLSFMGYCSPGWFWLRTDKNCVKYCSHPANMKYRNYRDMRQLYEEKGTDLPLMDSILKKLYPSLETYDFEKADVILITRPLDDFVLDEDKYKKRMEAFIADNYRHVLLKRHPREKGRYDFGPGTEVEEIDNSIPVEALFPYFRGKEVSVLTTSGSMICMSSFDIRCTVLVPDGLYEESIRTNSVFKPFSYEETDRFCKEFLKENYRLVRV